MIDEILLEKAVHYALGTLPAEDRPSFEKTLGANPRLQELVVRVRAVVEKRPEFLQQLPPSAETRAAILAEARAGSSLNPVPSAGAEGGPPSLLPWAMAAALAVFCSILLFQKNAREQRPAGPQGGPQSEVARMQQEVTGLRKATAVLEAQVREMAGSAGFERLKIVLLYPGDKASRVTAASVWDPRSSSGFFAVEGLAETPAGKDYQLWVTPAGGSPVDAGIFKVGSEGKVRFEFRPRTPVSSIEKITVTLEKKGGAPAPSGDTVLTGAVP